MKQEELINLRKNITYNINKNRVAILIVVVSVFFEKKEL